MPTITIPVEEAKNQEQKPRIYLIHAPGALEKVKAAPLEESGKDWKIIRWIKELFCGRSLTKKGVLRDRLGQARNFGIKPEDVENFWEGIEELRPSTEAMGNREISDPNTDHL